jgi:Flp pilus assembly protein TadD
MLFRFSFLFLPIAAICCALSPLPAQAQENAPAVMAAVPARSDSGLIKAESLLQRQKWAEALSELTLVLKRHPKSADAYTYQGYAEMNLGDIKAAEDSFNKALAFETTHLGANQYLGELYAVTGQLAKARDQLQIIRLICGKTDCAEERALRATIDRSLMSAR